jgi:hypothetical protein
MSEPFDIVSEQADYGSHEGRATVEADGTSEIPSWIDFPAARPVGAPVVEEVLGAGFTHVDDGQFPVPDAGAFEAGGPADVMAPCSVLAELTGQVLESGLDGLSDDEVVGVLRAARRVESWQAAVELAAVEELTARRLREQHDAGPKPAERASAELAVALTLTARSADSLMDLASGLARLSDVSAALSKGEIDLAKATVFVEETEALPWLQASVIAGRHVLVAPGLTTSQLRAVLRRAVLAADPDAGRRRQRQARQDAQVQTWPEASGNGAIAGRELPASRALLADKHISALAQTLRAAGMPGTMDQVRAEVFLALLSGQSPESLIAAAQPGSADSKGQAGAAFSGTGGGASTGSSASSGSGAPMGNQAGTSLSWPAGPRGTVHLTMPLDSWLRLGNNAGHVAGYGPADAWTCRELAGTMVGQPGTRFCLSITTPDGQPLGHACTKIAPPGAGPGPSRPRAPGRPPPGPTAPGLVAPGPAPPGIPDAMSAWIDGVQVEWLENGTCSHSRETSAYRPSRALDHLIKIRNPTCTAPGCRRPAQSCDIDHVIPYDQGGKTCECNCHPVCRRHHRCKQTTGWHVEMPEPGVLSWRLPHGRSYSARAEVYPV